MTNFFYVCVGGGYLEGRIWRPGDQHAEVNDIESARFASERDVIALPLSVSA